MPTQEQQRGQASVELVAVLPAMVLLIALAFQLALVGWGLWASAGAARAGARAAHVGGDPKQAARSAVPDALSEGFEAAGDPLEVSFRVPSLIPGMRESP